MKAFAALATALCTSIALSAEFTVTPRRIDMNHVFMNNHGHTVGESDAARFVSIATVNYAGNSIRTFAGRAGEESTAWGLSDNGVVLGASYNEDTGTGASGYWLDDGVFRLVPPTTTGTYATANLTNSRGWIVGFSDGQADRRTGLHIFRNGQTTAIGNPTPGYGLVIHDFASDGTIVGESVSGNEEGGDIFTWYWKEGQGFHVEPGRLTPPYYGYRRANGSGLLVGEYSPNSAIWTEQNGVRTFTGFSGALGDVNDRGDICFDPVGPTGVGVLRGGRFTPFSDNDLGVEVNAGILNDRGQALGRAYIGGRWTPAILTPVPEPGTWAAFLVGGALLYRRRRTLAASGD